MNLFQKTDPTVDSTAVEKEPATNGEVKQEPKAAPTPPPSVEEEIDPLDEFMMEIDKAVKPKASHLPL